MTRKDFEFIAAVIAAIEDMATREAVTLAFADALPRMNANFNRQRFFVACKVLP